MRQLGYVTLGDTMGGTTWFQDLTSKSDDMSLPVTAEVQTLSPSTVYIGSTARTSAPAGHRPRGFRGSRRRVDWHARASLLMVGVGAAMLWCAGIGLGAIAVYAFVLPLVFGR